MNSSPQQIIASETTHSHVPIEEMEVFSKYEHVTDAVWKIVSGWTNFEKDTIGKQLVRAMDSINLNLVEGDGRFSKADSLHFFVIARGSAREARLSLKRAQKRGLVTRDVSDRLLQELTEATKLLNALISYRRSSFQQKIVRETGASYGESDPFSQYPEALP